MKELRNKKIVIDSTHNFEDTQFIYPYYPLKEAGATVRDKAVVKDKNIIPSRFPPDLPALCKEIEALSKA